MSVDDAACVDPRSDSLKPAWITDIEMSEPLERGLPDRRVYRDYRELWLLVRIFDEPVGLVRLASEGAELSAETVLDAVMQDCGAVLAQRVEGAGGSMESLSAGLGTVTSATGTRRTATRSTADLNTVTQRGGTYLDGRRDVLERGPRVTVVICTRDRCRDLVRALDSLAVQSYPNFEVLVVDNAPSGDATRAAVAGREGIGYVCEPNPGLSWARNRALAQISTPIVAWLDDDEVADRHWLTELVAAFVQDPAVSAASGVVVPAELETLPQLWFEQYGGHSKARGFTPDVFRDGLPGGQSPLYPLPPFGVGANMAFRTEKLIGIGGFDVALGAGTSTSGGEDTLVFSQLLISGETVAYRPAAVTRHFHRRDVEALARQMAGYGTGLTAFYTALIRWDWRLIVPLAGLAPTAVRDVFGSDGRTTAGLPATFPRELLGLKTRAMLRGPIEYIRARVRARAVASRHP